MNKIAMHIIFCLVWPTIVFGLSFFPPSLDSVLAAEIKPTITIEDNNIYQNGRVGVRIRGSSPVMIKNCRLSENGRAGINIEHKADVRIVNNDIYNNQNGGISINDANFCLIDSNRVHQNHQGGIRIRKSEQTRDNASIFQISNNKIFLNKSGGLQTNPQAETIIELTVTGNDIFHNNRAGIRVENNTRLTAFHNRTYANGTAGIASYGTAEFAPLLDLYENRIYFNKGSGIHIHSGISGSFGISNNWIYNNLRAGIACGLWKDSDLIDIAIFHNTIVANGSNIMGAGIRNDSNGNIEIINNIIAYNFSTGIMTGNCRDASFNLLFANGETSSFDEDYDEYSFLVEKAQFSGCNGRRRGDLLSNPLFVDPDRYDFSLQDNSPARGAAKEMDLSYFDNFSNDIGVVAPSWTLDE